MPTTNKKQIGFYADTDNEEYLGSLESGIKTRTINEALRFYRKHHDKLEPLLVDRVELLERRVTRLEKQQ